MLLVKFGNVEVIETWQRLVKAQVGELISYSGVPPEPDTEAFRRVLEAAGPEPLDAVIGIGGGSVLDVAKLVAVVHGSTATVEAFFGTTPDTRGPALICLPTTAGTGSEVSPNAILYDPAEKAKRAVIGPALVPDATFIDPLFTVSLPPAVTAATGIDALSHCIEAYTNLHSHPMVDIYALEGIRLITGSLERAVKQGDDLKARHDMAIGSLYGGLCLGPVNTAGVHALSYPLGSRFRLPHGLSNALLLPHVMRFNLSANSERHAKIARAMGIQPLDSDEATGEAGIRKLEQLSERCGLPAGISTCGVTESDIPTLAAEALKITRLLRNNPRPIGLQDAMDIYQKAL